MATSASATTLPLRTTSAWDATQVIQFLQSAEQPLRLAVTSGDAPLEAPLVVPLWYQFVDGVFYCACPKHAKLIDLVQRSPQCGFDVSTNRMPYKGVRGQGEAQLLQEQGAATLERLIERYLKSDDSTFAQWLLSRAADEVAIALQPRWLTAWDFSARMTPS